MRAVVAEVLQVERILSVVVCTRNRPRQIEGIVNLLLQGELEDLELIVVDQSDDAETEAALAPLRTDSRLRYCRSAKQGKGAALNEGLLLARGAVIVCTDDDCLPPPGWAGAMAQALLSQPNAAICFCRVAPVPHDRTLGYVPAYEIDKSRRLRSILHICGGLGIGAGLAIRRDFVMAMGGFDEYFGPGGRFPSADEWDLAMRALLKGHNVYETAELTIVHDGFRTYAEGEVHARRDWLALGAVCAKPLRAGHWSVLIVAVWLFSTRAAWPPLRDVISLRRPRGLGRILAFMRGFVSGFGTAVDRKTLRFTERN
jgi:GT2 family glycosyltransferase